MIKGLQFPGCCSASLFLHNHLSPCPLPPPGGGDGGQVESGVELLGGGGRHHLQLLFTTPQRWCHHQSPSPFPTNSCSHCRFELERSPLPSHHQCHHDPQLMLTLKVEPSPPCFLGRIRTRVNHSLQNH